ncbi:MAG: hypothetical protein HXX19_09630 [Rhodoferax sp.]|nr:hypothetical protein [Rhodoferax sp.]
MNDKTAPVIFLDFDGVTHPEPSFQDNVFCRLDKIAAVLNRYPAVDIVISSSWRMHYTLDERKEFLSPIAADRVVGMTPSIKTPSPDWLPGVVPEHERQWDIKTWMKANRPWGTLWIAIDDRPQWFGPECVGLLLTDRKTGFTGGDAVLLQQMIEERL